MFKNYNLKSLSCTDLLFFIALTNTTLWGYVKIVLSRLPIIGSMSNVLTLTFVGTLIIICIPTFLKKLKPIDYIFFLFCSTIYIFQYIIYPENHFYLDETIIVFIIHTLPFYFVGRVIDYDKTSNFITLLAILSIIFNFIIRFVINANDDMTELYKSGDMHTAYILIPFIQLCILDAFKTHNVFSIVTSALSFIILLSFGNRGSVLYTTIFIVICIISTMRKKSISFKIFIISIIIILTYLYLGVFLENIYTKIEAMNMSTRIFDMIGEDGINTSGRDSISTRLINLLNLKWNGYGLLGDRVALNGSYAHNIFIEFLFSFGFIFGGFLCILLIYIIVKALIKCRNNNNYLFYWSLICFGLLPLMTSNSFLLYPFFFLFLGYTVQINKKKEKN